MSLKSFQRELIYYVVTGSALIAILNPQLAQKPSLIEYQFILYPTAWFGIWVAICGFPVGVLVDFLLGRKAKKVSFKQKIWRWVLRCIAFISWLASWVLLFLSQLVTGI